MQRGCLLVEIHKSYVSYRTVVAGLAGIAGSVGGLIPLKKSSVDAVSVPFYTQYATLRLLLVYPSSITYSHTWKHDVKRSFHCQMPPSSFSCIVIRSSYIPTKTYERPEMNTTPSTV